MGLHIEHHSPERCVFCRLISGELAAARVFEDEHTLAFMDLGQLNHGHTLVATKRHAATLLDLTPEKAAAAMRTAQQVARALDEVFSSSGITLLQANGKEGEQTVFHFHSHVLPRHPHDGIGLIWPRKHPPADMLAGYAQRLSAALG